MAFIEPDYAKLEVQIVFEEKARALQRIEYLDRKISDYYAQPATHINGPHPLEKEYRYLQDHLRSLDKLIALIPVHKIPTSVSVSYRAIPIKDPNAKVEILTLPEFGTPLSEEYAALAAAQMYALSNPPSPPSFDLKLDKDGNLEMVDGAKALIEHVKKRLGVSSDTAELLTAGIQPYIGVDPMRLISTTPTTKSDKWGSYEKLFDNLKKVAKLFKKPVVVKKDDSSEDNMSDIQTLGPLGFKVLLSKSKGPPSGRLFYKIDKDGGVTITGEKRPCVLHCDLSDGSLLAGGISPRDNGTLFGDRIYRENGVEVKKPLRWIDVGAVVKSFATALQKPNPVPPKPNPQNIPKAKSLNLPVQSIAPPPSKGSVENAAKILKMVDQGLMSRSEAMKALGIDEWPLQADSPVPDEMNPTHSRFELIFGRPGQRSKRSPWTDVPTVEQYKTLQENYQNMQREMIQMKALLSATQDQNEKLTKKLKRAEETVATIRHETEVELEKIKNAKLLSQDTRRWQIEVVKNTGVTIEGADATIFELEDVGDNLKYLVIATVPSGTPNRVQEQWMEDLQKSLDMRFGEGVVEYVIAPQDASISLLEVLPGVEEDQEEDDLFQF